MRLLNNNIHVSSELRLGEILVCFVRCSIIALLRVAARTARSFFFFATLKLKKSREKRQEEYIKVSIEPESAEKVSSYHEMDHYCLLITLL